MNETNVRFKEPNKRKHCSQTKILSKWKSNQNDDRRTRKRREKKNTKHGRTSKVS